MTYSDPSPVPASGATRPWRVATRVAFRFCVSYFGIYVLCTQMIGDLVHTVNWQAPSLGELPPMSSLVMWVIRHVFHDGRTLAMAGGSGDKMFDWVQALCFLVLAGIVTGVWSIADRRRTSYPRLHRWFRVFLRFALGSTLISYGAAKAVPLQMPAPSLTRLLEPYGNFSPMGVLWASIGASRPYEIFTGCVELLAGILLFIPRTQLLGASIALAATTQIFTLNMTYDVPVKLFSFHLVLMSSVLLAPDVKRVCAAVFYHRVTWLAAGAQVVFGAYLVTLVLYGSAVSWHGPFAGGAAKPPLYGVWTIDRMTVDGVDRPPLVTDGGRWRRMVVQNASSVIFWQMDDTYLFQNATIDIAARTIALGRGPKAPATSHFTFEQAAPDQLVLDGDFEGRRVHLDTHLVDPRNFPLVSRGFHWIQESPFNR